MNRAPRVAAVHDMSGIGRCSLTAALPVLAAMGAWCCPMPTAYLSAHTAFPLSDQAVFLDMTGQMAGTARHWRELGMEFQAIYSGFLGSEEQIGLLRRFLAEFRRPGAVVLVDPVMGDHGQPYRTYTPEMCSRMGLLAAEADLITPNLTEAALLLGVPYAGAPTSERGAAEWLERLSLEGRRSVVLTGLSFAPGTVGAGCLDRATGRIRFAMEAQEPGHFPGTGDLFASVVLGALLRGETLEEASAQAVRFVRRCVARTLAAGTPPLEGVEFEPLLRELMDGGRTAG